MILRRPAVNLNDSRRQSRQAVLGHRLRQLRIARNLTLGELSEMTHCSQDVLRRVEKGDAMPSLPMLQRLAQALGVDSGSLVGEIVRGVGYPSVAQVADRTSEP